MSAFAAFQPETLTTGLAPLRSLECQVTEMVCDSPGHSVMSLPFHSEDCSSLSPGSSRPPGVPRRMSARRKKPTVRALERLVMVTVVSRSAPSGPLARTVRALALTVAAGRLCRAVRFAYEVIVACG